MFRHVVALGVACSLMVVLRLPTADVAAQDCGSCAAAIATQTNWQGELDVCFYGSGFSENHRTWFEQGIESYIGSWLSGNSTGVSFSFRVGQSENDCDDADVKIFEQSGLGSDIAEAGPSHGIGVNPSFLAGQSGADFWKWVATHEMLHVFGFAHSDQSCASLTVLVPTYPGGSYQFPSGPLCADSAALTTLRNGSNEYVEEEYYYDNSEEYEDCFDVYRVHVTYYLNSSGQVVQISVWYEWIDWTCDPLPEG